MRYEKEGWITLAEFLETGRTWVLLEVKGHISEESDNGYLWVNTNEDKITYLLASEMTNGLFTAGPIGLNPKYSGWLKRLVRPLPPGAVVRLPFGTIPEDEEN
jgi:hypothetical protein